MSEIKVNNIQSLSGANGPVVSGITTMASSGAMSLPRGDTAYRGGRGRGLTGGGNPSTNIIDYITIATLGDAKDFGDLVSARDEIGGCSSATRGIFAGGETTNAIDYVTIQSTGNAFDFGDLTETKRLGGGLSNQTRGLFAGNIPTNNTNVDYITIGTLGNASEFGNLTQTSGWGDATSSTTRGLFQIAGFPSSVNSVEYVTIATTGDAQDFGDLSRAKRNSGACSSPTRALFGGGHPGNPSPNNTTIEIDYFTIASLGDALDFGDLTTSSYPAATSSSTRGIFAGGWGQPANGQINVISYVTIATLGDAQDFGDITRSVNQLATCSDSHGGLG
ncbi:MAG: hypothetical protein VW270_19755 [Candidatus Poseidoniales archaeon]